MTSRAVDLAERLDGRDPAATLEAFRREVEGRIVFTTSFGLEDQVLTHMILTRGLDVAIVTLDTGRLFQETHMVWAATEARYRLRIPALLPETRAVEELLARDGADGFRASVAARRECCDIRKVRPLARALAGAAGWITGVRADQSAARASVPLVAFDETYGVLKLAPLARWTREDVARFAEANDVPVNALHARGFPSIGCAPCTRAVAPGEPERAGRWWWEDGGSQECGLHVGPDGRLARTSRTEARP